MKSHYQKISTIVLVIIVIFLFNIDLTAQDSLKSEKKVIVGKFTWDNWCDSSGWKQCKVDYNITDEKKSQLEKLLTESNFEIFLFAGSWCGDSESEMPKIINILDFIKFDKKKLYIYGVDRQKREPSNTALMFKIEKVPTLIISDEYGEVGRIVEFPENGQLWEDAILKIIKR